MNYFEIIGMGFTAGFSLWLAFRIIDLYFEGR